MRRAFVIAFLFGVLVSCNRPHVVACDSGPVVVSPGVPSRAPHLATPAACVA